MRDIQPGDRVAYGFRTGRVLRLVKRGRAALAVVTSDARLPGDGSYPHEVPVSFLRKVDEVAQ